MELLNIYKVISNAFNTFKLSCVAHNIAPLFLRWIFIISIKISRLSLSRKVDGSSKIQTLAGQKEILNKLNLLFSPADNQEAGKFINFSNDSFFMHSLKILGSTDHILAKNNRLSLTVSDPFIASK